MTYSVISRCDDQPHTRNAALGGGALCANFHKDEERTVIISLDSKNRIRGTEMCWQLERTRMRKGRVVWQPYKYFPTFDQALAAAGEREIRTAETHGLAEAIRAVHQLIPKYSQIVEAAIGEHERRSHLRLVS